MAKAVSGLYIYGENMSNELHITSPIPPSVNHYMGYRAILKNGKPMAIPYKTAKAVSFCKDFAKIVEEAVDEQGWNLPIDSGRHIYVDAVFYFPRLRMDCNNYWKVLLDTITDTQLIWKDDDIVCERAQAIYYDAQNPRIELVIHPVDYIGVFENASQLEEFESRCIGCTRYARNCSILRQAKTGKIQSEIQSGNCEKYKEKK